MNGEREQATTVALLDARYQLHERVGEGGMAEVYRAEDVVLGRTVAIKLMRTDATLLATDTRARGEVTALATLNHPSLVTLLDARVDHGRSRYLVMEYVDGPTLADRLSSGPLPGADVVRLARELAEGLDAVHAAGLVHRDVKPSNVLLAPGTALGGGFHVKLADFGLAELSDTDQATVPGLVLGTAAYLAPEQVRGAGSRPASDIYAFGLVLLEALTGERAFAHTTGIGAVLARLTEQPSIPDGLDAGWAALLTAMTARDPDARPSALEVAERVAELPAPRTEMLVPAVSLSAHLAPRRPIGRHVAARRRLPALSGPQRRWSRRALVATAIAAACLIAIQASVLAWGISPEPVGVVTLEVEGGAAVVERGAVGTVMEREDGRVPGGAVVEAVARPAGVRDPGPQSHAGDVRKDAAAVERDARKDAAAVERAARKDAAAVERAARKDAAAEERAARKDAAAGERAARKGEPQGGRKG